MPKINCNKQLRAHNKNLKQRIKDARDEAKQAMRDAKAYGNRCSKEVDHKQAELDRVDVFKQSVWFKVFNLFNRNATA